ncbi:MAG TPA: hypothetical protein VJ824_08275 [Bacillota bacterium]|nr:hypothetical protein [Bacillota bacterium]
MHYHVYQKVTLCDFNNELLTEVLYYHGEYSLPLVSPGVTFITPALGLKKFEVVEDHRLEPQRYRVADIEVNLLEKKGITKVFLDPITLIVGQHDIGEFSE